MSVSVFNMGSVTANPGMGTILNILIIALVIDLSLPYLPQFETLSLQIIEALAGVIITGIGGGICLIAKLGAGPRDGLMTGLQRVPICPWQQSSGIEMTVVILGWMLGGVVGIGTVLFAFGIGPSVAASMYVLQMSFNRKE